MRHGEPSRTAWSAAVYRAAHQLVDRFQLYDDPLALRILGIAESEVRSGRQAQPGARRMRLFIAARTTFADEVACAAIDGGTRQVVVLGAGLDTFAYRHPDVPATVFEVDHPATQVWKRDRLADAGIDVPGNVVFVGVDFEVEEVADALAAQGFRFEEPACFLWLGVTPYLTREAAAKSLALAGGAAGNEIVFDYANPPEALDPTRRSDREAMAARVAAIGEPWIGWFETDELADLLRASGFDVVDDLDPAALIDRFFGVPSAERNGAHLVHARRSAQRIDAS